MSFLLIFVLLHKMWMLVCAQNRSHCLQNRYSDHLLVPDNELEFESYSDMVDTYQLFLCRDVRLCTKNRDDLDAPHKCCDDCSCDSSCGTLQNCCPDIQVVPVQKYSIHPECVRMKYFKKMISNEYMVFTTCSNKSQQDWVDKCHNLDMLEAVPVSINNSQIAFKNTYCAWCNNEFDVVEWKVKVVCDQGDTIFASTLEDLRIKINLRADDCNVLVLPPYKYALTCFDVNLRYVDTCNVTEKWTIYHPWIEQACHSYTSVYYYDTKTKYKNVFCFFCNMDSNSMKEFHPFHPNSKPYSVCRTRETSIGAEVHEFSAILNFQTKISKPTTTIRRKCEDGFVIDNVKNTCRQLKCHPPLRYDISTAKCVSASHSNNKGNYRATFKLDTSGVYYSNCSNCCPTKVANKLHNEFYNPIKIAIGKVKGLCFVQILNCTHILPTEGEENLYNYIYDDDYHGNIPYVIGIYDIYLESESIVLSHDVVFTIFMSLNITTTLTSIPDNFETPINRPITVDGWDYTSFVKDDNDVYVDPTSGKSLIPCTWSAENGNHTLSTVKEQDTVRLTRLMVCPFVEMSIEEYDIVRDGTDICVNGLNYCVSAMNYTLNNGSIAMCYDSFKVLPFFAIQIGQPEVVIVSAHWILSAACTLVSVLSLVATVVTYCVFSSLRNVAGANILALSLSLLLAFGFTTIRMFGTFFGGACVFIGISIHWFWLNSFSWMLVCCGDVFQTLVIVKVPENKLSRSWKTSIWYIVFSVVFSSTFLFSNVFSRMLETDMEDIGYSDVTCDISTGENIGYTVALPLALVIVVNILLFSVVGVKFYRMPNLDKHVKTQRNDLLIFLKLSTITGIAWAFGFIYPLTEIIIFNYLFSLSGALQGFFIMVSFVFNKRVIGLYKRKFSVKVPERTESTKTSFKISG